MCEITILDCACIHYSVWIDRHSIISGCKFLSQKYYINMIWYWMYKYMYMYTGMLLLTTIYYENKSMSETIVHITNWPHLGALMCLTNSTCLLSLGTELHQAPSTPYCTWLLHHPQYLVNGYWPEGCNLSWPEYTLTL